jgi:hypothetical protein
MARKRNVETADFAEMMKRMIQAHGKRVADGDVADLADFLDIAALLDAEIAHAVREMRARWGLSWADIGTAAGTTRSAAFQRWGKPWDKATA